VLDSPLFVAGVGKTWKFVCSEMGISSPFQAFSIQLQNSRTSRAVRERSIDKVGGLQRENRI
jgi:hypothetical protein